MESKINIFYSYCHKDEILRDDLEKHLSILKRRGLIEQWHDRKIRPGDRWEEEIESRADDADIILFLVSADFIASDYCYCREVTRALDRHQLGQCRVVPLILRPVEWHGAPFDKLQALPRDGKPVTTWANIDEAWVDIAKGLKTIVEEMSAQKSSTTSKVEHVSIKNILASEVDRIKNHSVADARTRGWPTGFVDLDKLTDGLHSGDIVLLAGRPSMGKIDFVSNVASRFAVDRSQPVLFLSMRQTPEKVTRRMLSSFSEIPLHRIMRSEIAPKEARRLAHALKILNEAPIEFEGRVSVTDTEIEQVINIMQKKGDLGLIVIDGIENIAPKDRHANRNLDVASVSETLKRLSRAYNIPMLVTATVSGDVDLRRDKRPRMKDLDEWEDVATHIANIVVFLYRDEVYYSDAANRGIAELILAKNEYGPTDTIRLAYLQDCCMFLNLYLASDDADEIDDL